MIKYLTNSKITTEQFIDLLMRSSLAERRPVEDRECIEAMLENADILVSAWENEKLIGIARSVSDFSYCCYLSDLAVDKAHQKQGIGKELIRQTQSLLGPKCKIILLSAPAAIGYYPKVGFEKHDQCWVKSGQPSLN